MTAPVIPNQVKTGGKSNKKRDAIEEVRESVVMRLLQGKHRGTGGRIEQSVPEPDGQDWNHPGCSVVGICIDMENEFIAGQDNYHDQESADSQNRSAVLQEDIPVFTARAAGKLRNKRIADARAELQNNLPGNVR